MSNMDMKIVLNKKNKLIKVKNSYLVDKKNIKHQIIPSFTKKILSSKICVYPETFPFWQNISQKMGKKS